MTNKNLYFILLLFLLSCQESVDYDKMYIEYVKDKPTIVTDEMSSKDDDFRGYYVNGVQRLILRRDSFDISYCENGILTPDKIVELEKQYESDTVLFNYYESKFRDSIFNSVSIRLDSVKHTWNNITSNVQIECFITIKNETMDSIFALWYNYTVHEKFDSSRLNGFNYFGVPQNKHPNESWEEWIPLEIPENHTENDLLIKLTPQCVKHDEETELSTLYDLDSLKGYWFDLEKYIVRYDTIWKRRY